MKSRNRILTAAIASALLLPVTTRAGTDITTSNYVPGGYSAASGYLNSVVGAVCFAAGQQNGVFGSYNSIFGFNSVINNGSVASFSVGGGHNITGNFNFVTGYLNTVTAPGQSNFLSGTSNSASGNSSFIGGLNNVSTGNQSFMYGSFLNDGGQAGSVMLSDSNPFNLRTAGNRFTNVTPDTFNGSFNRGYFLFTDDGQPGAASAGLFIVPTPANSAVVANPAFVGINTIAPVGTLEVSSDSETDVFATAFSSTGGDPNFIGRRARGTSAAPSAVLANDNLAFFGGRGYGTTGFAGSSSAAMVFAASQNHTDAAKGTFISFLTTADNTANRVERMRINRAGDVQITGRLAMNKSLPASAVLDIRHPTSGAAGDIFVRLSDTAADVLYMRTFVANGPLNPELLEGDAFKPGGGAWGVVSDRRLKKNIEPLAGALDQLLKLRSVTFEYKEPEKVHQFPGKQTGFIAQEVEQVFPEWVTTNAEGFKAVTVRSFESLAVQALRELRNEKDAEIAALKKQLAAQEAAAKAQKAAHAAQLSAIEARLARLEQAAPVAVPVKLSLTK